MAKTRRFAAILAADVVGYSRLMGEDEAGTAEAVREHREAANPKVWWPASQDNGRRRSIRVSVGRRRSRMRIAIQKQMAESNVGVPEGKRVLYRMGVNLGDVLIEGDDILGDASY